MWGPGSESALQHKTMSCQMYAWSMEQVDPLQCEVWRWGSNAQASNSRLSEERCHAMRLHRTTKAMHCEALSCQLRSECLECVVYLSRCLWSRGRQEI
jgi:hypothetical protein